MLGAQRYVAYEPSLLRLQHRKYVAALTRLDPLPRGSFGNQNPYVEKMRCHPNMPAAYQSHRVLQAGSALPPTLRVKNASFSVGRQTESRVKSQSFLLPPRDTRPYPALLSHRFEQLRIRLSGDQRLVQPRLFGQCRIQSPVQRRCRAKQRILQI